MYTSTIWLDLLSTVAMTRRCSIKYKLEFVLRFSIKNILALWFEVSVSAIMEISRP